MKLTRMRWDANQSFSCRFVEHVLKKANADNNESDTDVVDTESGAGKIFKI